MDSPQSEEEILRAFQGDTYPVIKATPESLLTPYEGPKGPRFQPPPAPQLGVPEWVAHPMKARWDDFISGLKAPYREWESSVQNSWSSPHFYGKPVALGKLALSGLQTLASPIPSFFNALSHHPGSSFQEYVEHMPSQPGESKAVERGAAFLADVATDPTTALSFGPKTAAKGAQILGKTPILTSPMVEEGAARMLEASHRIMPMPRLDYSLSEKKAMTWLGRRKAAQIPEVVQKFAAPRQIAEHLLYNSGRVSPEVLEAAFGAGKTQGLAGAVPGSTIPQSFEDLLKTYRGEKDLTAFRKMPESLVSHPPGGVGPSLPVDRQIHDLARHMVQAERDIWAGRPLTRYFGWNLANIPSPVQIASRLARATIGRTVGLKMPILPQAQFDTLLPGLGRSASEFFNSRGMPVTPTTSLSEVEKMLISAQKGAALHDTREAALIKDWDHLDEWLKKELGWMGPANRRKHLAFIRNMYQGIRNAAAKEPNALFSRTPAELDHALVRISQWINSPALKQQLKDLDVTLYPRPLDSQEAAIRNTLTDLTQYMQDLATQYGHAFPGGPAAGPGPLAGSLDPNALLKAHSAAGGPGVQYAVRDVARSMERLRLQYQKLLESMTSYEHAAQSRHLSSDLWGEIQKIQGDARSLQQALHNLIAGNDSALTGAEVLARTMGTPVGQMAWPALLSRVRPRPYTVRGVMYHPVPGAPLTARDFTRFKAGAARTLVDLEHAGEITPAGAAQAKQLLSQLDPQGASDLIRLMEDVAHTKGEIQIKHQMVEYLTQPLSDMIGQAEQLLQTKYHKEVQAILADLAKYQNHLDLHGFVQKGLPVIVNAIDRLKHRVFRELRIDPQMEQVLKSQQAGAAENKRQAVLKAQNEYAKSFLGLYHAARGTAAPKQSWHGFDPGISQHEQGLMEEAVAKWVGSMASLHKVHPDAKWAGRVRAVATEYRSQAMKTMTDLLKDPVKARNFLQAAEKAFTDHHLKNIEMARLNGLFKPKHVGIPYQVENMGSVKNLKDADGWLHHEEAQKIFGADAPNYHFADAAEKDAFYRYYNEAVNPTRPVKHRMIHNASGLLGQQHYNFLNSSLLRKTTTALDTMMPAHGTFRAGKNAPPSWKDLEDLFPELQGWKVPPALHRYLGMFSNMEERENEALNLIYKSSTWQTRLSTNFSLNHLKNMAALAYYASLHPKHFMDTMLWVLTHPTPMLESERFYKIRHPLERWKFALDALPEYQQAVREGFSHMDVHEGQPVWRIMEQSVRPKRFDVRLPGVGTRIWTDFFPGGRGAARLAGAQGPFSTLMFDIMDRVYRFSLYKQFKEAGAPGSLAAEFANRHMIDYSSRFLSPEARVAGHAAFTFFPWTVGNAMLHIPNMIENPRMYAVESMVRNLMNNEFSGTTEQEREDKKHFSSLLAFAYGTRWRNAAGQQMWVMPESPAYAWERLMTQMATRPQTAPWELAKFATLRTRPGGFISDALNYAKSRQRENEPYSNLLLGQAKDSLWGLAPYFMAAETAYKGVMEDPRYWSDMRWVLWNMLMKVRPAEVHKGKFKPVE